MAFGSSTGSSVQVLDQPGGFQDGAPGQLLGVALEGAGSQVAVVLAVEEPVCDQAQTLHSQPHSDLRGLLLQLPPALGKEAVRLLALLRACNPAVQLFRATHRS